METKRSTAPTDPLQFDHAERPTASAGGPASCTACGRAITDRYFEANGSVVCPNCRARLVSARGGSGGRFSKAAALGLLAGAVGSGIYYAIAALTGYEFGLVAVVVGFLVGGAVRKGSNGRGGWAYQALAMFITYGAIVTTYIPFIVRGIRDQAAVADSMIKPEAAALRLAEDSVTLTLPVDSVAVTVPLATRVTATASEGASPTVGVLGVVLGVTLICALAFAAPVLAGFQNIIGMLIIGFALYEAWRLNKRTELSITGPYRIGATGGGLSTR